MVLLRVALHIGPVALVQPVLVTGLVFGTIASARLARRRLDRRLLVAWVRACWASRRSSLARPQVPAVPPSPAFGPLFGVAVVAGVIGVLGLRGVAWGEPVRAALLALRPAGLRPTATLFSTALREPSLLAALTTWYGAGAVVSAICGWALSQRALHLGRMNAPVNAVIGTTDPAVAVLLGVLVLGERVASTPLDLIGEILSAAVVVAGTVVVARHSAAVLRDDRAGVPTPAWG